MRTPVRDIRRILRVTNISAYNGLVCAPQVEIFLRRGGVAMIPIQVRLCFAERGTDAPKDKKRSRRGEGLR